MRHCRGLIVGMYLSKSVYNQRYLDQERFGKSLMIGSDPSDSEETDDDDIQESSISKQMEIYNPKEFEDLNVSTELKELFQNISRYHGNSF